MNEFLGIEFGSKGYKIKHIIMQNGQTVEKTSDVVFWIVYKIRDGRLYTPVSKLDMSYQTFLVPSQALGALNDRTRSLVKKTDDGLNVIPFGAIIIK